MLVSLSPSAARWWGVGQSPLFETFTSTARARAIFVPVNCPASCSCRMYVGHTYRSDETELLGVERVYEESGFKTKFQAAQNILETLSLLCRYSIVTVILDLVDTVDAITLEATEIIVRDVRTVMA